MPKEPVDLIGHDEFLEGQATRLQAPCEINRLLKRDIAVVVPLDQKYRRFPAVDACVGRRGPSDFQCRVAITFLETCHRFAAQFVEQP